MEKQEKGRCSSRVRVRVRVRVVLIPCPLEGHLPPMLLLGTLLHSKGFSITIAYSELNSPNTSKYPYFKFIKLQDGLYGRDTSFYSLLTLIPEMNHNCKEPLHKYLEEEESDVVSCLIYDPVMYFTDAVATDRKIPGVIFKANNATYLQALRLNLKLSAQLQDAILPESQLLDLVPDLDHLRFKDLPIPLHIRIPEIVLKLEAEMSSIRSAVAIILNTANDLENSVISQLKQDCQIPFFPIGPLHKMVSSASTTASHLEEEDRISSCIEWLNQQAPNSVVYVCLGSLAILQGKDLVEIAWGLANSKQPFLWVVRPGSIQGSKWIEELPDEFLEKVKQTGLIVKWAPQKEVLAHRAIGTFWSHCGWNSTLESICEGVTLICRPCFSDQMVNARYLAHVWKVGLELESPLQREAIEKAIHRVMIDDEGKDLKINVLKLKKKLEASVKEDGNSGKSLDNLVEFIASFRQQK